LYFCGVPQVHAFFDFDDTLLRGDSILYWQRFYYAQRPARRVFQLLNWAGLVLHGLKVLDSHGLKRLFLLPMAYEKPEVLDALARDFVRQDLARRFHAPVLKRLWAHHLLGHKVVIISASATFYLKHLKALLPMAEIMGSEMYWPTKGLWRLPRYRDGNLRGANKLVRLKALGYGDSVPLSFSYSDHHHDAFLLGYSEFPTCVRPTLKLRLLAAAKGWPVLDWTRESPSWLEKLGKLMLLVLGAGPRDLGRAGDCDPEKDAVAAPGYLESEGRALRERVQMKYSEDRDPEIFRTIFGSAGLTASAGAADPTDTTSAGPTSDASGEIPVNRPIASKEGSHDHGL
jgi:phosphoserine phosphatase